jgi:hypothetical protein
MLAVSQQVMPSSTAWRQIGSARSSSSVAQGSREPSPKAMQPTVILLIFKPDVPRRTHSMLRVFPP